MERQEGVRQGHPGLHRCHLPRSQARRGRGFHNRRCAWLAKKKYDKATQDYNEAVRLDPNYFFTNFIIVPEPQRPRHAAGRLSTLFLLGLATIGLVGWVWWRIKQTA
jgi:hypothetical protein